MKLSSVYDPSQYEGDIYALWEKSQAFQPSNAKSYYSVVVPPPNANGDMHLGTAFTVALQDVAIRYHRLKGDSALLLPGADHAGFETQVVYERLLAKEGKSRFDFTRDELYARIYEFVGSKLTGFEKQFRLLGGSVDWSRFTFTLDDMIVRRAYATFKQLWDDGLVYRGERLVNYCTFHGTAFADIEVEHQEATSHLWFLRYPLTDGSGELVVATTRPETMFGDTAVAVHPEDKRYAQFIGKTVKLPLTEREIPVIADDFVDQEFGTGAVKITPAHDQNDFDAGKRHDLPMVTVIDFEGNMTSEVPPAYRGLPVKEARKAVVAALKDDGILAKTEDLTHNVGHCYKCGTVIEPLLREQWFVDMQPLAREAIAALKADKITFYPEAKKHQLINYLENIRDWNISRQIAWGIPIPAFQNVDNPDDWIFHDGVEELEIQRDGKTYRRDPDVFDTWFSSSSWPYATLAYPDSDDFKKFYPLSLMETGGEILYPWVSRMIMLGLYVTGEIPFKAVYIHGYVMAEDGSKMSKSIGNVINPVEVLEKYGADAMRMGLIAGRAPAINRGYDPRKVEDARNFCNKLWNIARYIEGKVGDTPRIGEVVPASAADHWLLRTLGKTVDGLANDLDNYRFAEAYERLYHFVWNDFADWYIEASKAQENLPLLVFALETILKVAHPYAPFVTETIWQTLAWRPDSLLISETWPEVPQADEQAARSFESLKTLVVEARRILKNLNIRQVELDYVEHPVIDNNLETLKRLAGISKANKTASSDGMQLALVDMQAWLKIDAEAARRYADKLAEQHQEAAIGIERLEDRLANASYVQNAPKELVAQTRQQLEDTKIRLEKITAEQQAFGT